MKDLYGVGPALKAFSMLFLAVSIITRNLNYVIGFFLFYGIGSGAFLTHLYALKEIKNTKKPVRVEAGIYEQFFNIGLCFIFIIYFAVLNLQKHK